MGSNIQLYNFKPGFKHELEILSLDALYSDSHQTVIKPHRTNFYQVFWIQSGPHKHVVDFKPVNIPKNAFLFVNKAQVQSFDRSASAKGKLILFTDNFFSKTPDDLKFLNSSILFNDFLAPAIIKLSRTSHQMMELFEKLEEEFNKPDDPYHYDLLRNILHNFLMVAERQRRQSGFTELKRGTNLDYLVLFKELLTRHFKEVRSVARYAALINVSEKRLAQATMAILGKTPKKIIDEQVLLEVKRLLAHTSQSIKQISYQLNFEEPTNFIKYFRKHEGITPIEFREKFAR